MVVECPLCHTRYQINAPLRPIRPVRQDIYCLNPNCPNRRQPFTQVYVDEGQYPLPVTRL